MGVDHTVLQPDNFNPPFFGLLIGGVKFWIIVTHNNDCTRFQAIKEFTEISPKNLIRVQIVPNNLLHLLRSHALAEATDDFLLQFPQKLEFPFVVYRSAQLFLNVVDN